MLEKDTESYLVKKIREAGGRALKLTVPGKSGMPDRLILVPGGEVIFAEIKAPGEKPRPLQKKRIEDLRKLGFKVVVIDSHEHIESIVEVVKWQNSLHMTTKDIP